MSDSENRRLAKELAQMSELYIRRSEVLDDASRLFSLLADREEKGYRNELEFKDLLSRVRKALVPGKARKRKL